MNNPIIFFDPNGKDPNREQLASYADVMSLVESWQGYPIETLVLVLLFSDVRYLYTEEAGFIDLLHFFAAAEVSAKSDFLFNKEDAEKSGVKMGDWVEIFQYYFSDDSAWDPEDPRSNLEGAGFGATLNKQNSLLIGNDFINKLSEYLLDLKPIDKNDPSLYPENVYIKESKKRGRNAPQRKHGYEPYWGMPSDYGAENKAKREN